MEEKVTVVSVVSREEVAKLSEYYAEIMARETHHEHEIIRDKNGTLRWKENPTVNQILDRVNLNDLWVLFSIMGLDKNSEAIRNLYREMGYSISGYWEIFYWEVNNEIAHLYRTTTDSLIEHHIDTTIASLEETIEALQKMRN